MQRPELIVKMTGYTRESGGLGRIQASVVLTNEGPRVARASASVSASTTKSCGRLVNTSQWWGLIGPIGTPCSFHRR